MCVYKPALHKIQRNMGKRPENVQLGENFKSGSVHRTPVRLRSGIFEYWIIWYWDL